MTDRIFISHASEDAAVAERIVAYLEARGVPCWIASRDIQPRAIYADAIVEGMQRCGACAVLVSAASNASKAVKREVELASHEDKAFIPIRIDGSEPTSGLAYYLRNTQWVEYKRDGERALDRIANPAAEAVAAATASRGPRASTRPRTMILLVAIPILAGAVGLGAWLMGLQSNRNLPDPSEVLAEVLGAPQVGVMGSQIDSEASDVLARRVVRSPEEEGWVLEISGDYALLQRQGYRDVGAAAVRRTFYENGVLVTAGPIDFVVLRGACATPEDQTKPHVTATYDGRIYEGCAS